MTSGIAEVQARVAELQLRFANLAASAPGSGTAFAAALNQAKAATATSATAASASNGQVGQPTGADVVAAARRYLGVPYVRGGTDPDTGLDCSGLVQRVFKDLGIELPRVSRDQARQGTPVASLADAKPGDLVAFGSPVNHIGIYVGDGKMLAAPYPGKNVRIEKITDHVTGIRRVVPAAGAEAASGAAASGDVVPYADLFRSAAAKHGVPAKLLAAVAKAESGFRADAVSHAGARGLMQLMPGTARELGVDAFVPKQAVDGAARLLAKHLRDFGSVPLALAAYNAGPGAVRRYDGVPPYNETRTYIERVTRNMKEVRV